MLLINCSTFFLIIVFSGFFDENQMFQSNENQKHLCEVHILQVFTITFDTFYAFLLNKSIYLLFIQIFLTP